MKPIPIAVIVSLVFGWSGLAMATYHPSAALGWNMIVAGYYEEGRHELQRAILKEPDDYRYRFAYAKSFWIEAQELITKGKTDDAYKLMANAEPHARAALKNAKKSQVQEDIIWDIKSLIAAILLQRERYKEACAILDDFVTPGSSGWYQYLYGLCLRMQYLSSQNAEWLYKSSFYLSASLDDGVNPESRPLAYYFLGIDAYVSGSITEATEKLNTWLSVAQNPHRSIILYHLSEGYHADAQLLLVQINAEKRLMPNSKVGGKLDEWE